MRKQAGSNIAFLASCVMQHKKLFFQATTPWLSLGNVFTRVFELRPELLTFQQLEKYTSAESFLQKILFNEV